MRIHPEETTDHVGEAGTRRFDFQTQGWHAGLVPTTPLADLAGRPCPIAAAMEVVGERWALLVIREIALGAKRFSAIVAGTGAPRDRIAARLKTLEAAGVIARTTYQNHPPRHEYGLTESGRDLLPVLDALLEWGAHHAVAADDPLRSARYRQFVRPGQTR
jgi:DNA-binding HxlR family transcriptional regulator